MSYYLYILRHISLKVKNLILNGRKHAYIVINSDTFKINLPLLYYI